MMRSLARTLTSVALSLAIVVPALIDAGCASHANDHLNAAVETLSSNGVGVYERYDATAAPIQAIAGVRSAMKVTRWQLANMVNQADVGMGIRGADLDRLVAAGAPKKLPPFSYFIAAWLKNGASPLAIYGRQLMGKQTDYKHAPKMTFSLLVITLLIADIARVPNAKRTAAIRDNFWWEGLIAQPAQASGICSTVSDFLKSTVTDIENAIKSTSTGVLPTIWNTFVDIVVEGIGFIVQKVLAPFLSAIATIIGGLVLITTIASSLQAWTVEMQENPESVYLTDNALEGKITAVLHAPSIPWPSDLSDCSDALTGVNLNTINSKDAPVTWDTFGMFPEVATVTDKATKIDANNRADLSFSTKPWDTSNKQCATYRNIGYLGAHAYVERQDIARLEDQLFNLIAAQLPKFISDIVGDGGHGHGIFQTWLNSANQSFNSVLKSQLPGTGTTQVWELQSDLTKCTASPKPTPTVQPSPNPSASGNVDDTALVGTWACDVHATVTNKELGAFSVTVQSTLTFNKDGTGTGFMSEGAAFQGSHSIVSGPGNGPIHEGRGTYAYVPQSAGSGTLRYGGIDHPVAWSGANAWTMHVTSKVSHRTYTLNCSRH